jgi:hypothetical protein
MPFVIPLFDILFLFFAGMIIMFVMIFFGMMLITHRFNCGNNGGFCHCCCRLNRHQVNTDDHDCRKNEM